MLKITPNCGYMQKGYFNPELAGGNGLSGTTGIAGFPNGEIFRIGDPTPQLTVARFFITQTIALSDGDSLVTYEANQLAGRQPSDRLTLTFGKIGVTDYQNFRRALDRQIPSSLPLSLWVGLLYWRLCHTRFLDCASQWQWRRRGPLQGYDNIQR